MTGGRPKLCQLSGLVHIFSKLTERGLVASFQRARCIDALARSRTCEATDSQSIKHEQPGLFMALQIEEYLLVSSLLRRQAAGRGFV
jgi:hypothetical protein